MGSKPKKDGGTFRVRYGSGSVDIEASSPAEARKIFEQQHPKEVIDRVKFIGGRSA